MKQIRRCVFETNSSSTHSISIYKWQKPEEINIPRNTTLEVSGKISGRTEITDEVGKLNYIVVMLASVLEYEDEMDYETSTFEDVVNSKLFVWLKEIVKEKSNTEIIYKQTYDYFPFFETTYDEGRGIKEVFGCDLNNEVSFKERITSIIYEPDMIIEDKESKY